MEALDPNCLAERLEGEDKGYRLYLESNAPLEKYPGLDRLPRIENMNQLTSNS